MGVNAGRDHGRDGYHRTREVRCGAVGFVPGNALPSSCWPQSLRGCTMQWNMAAAGGWRPPADGGLPRVTAGSAQPPRAPSRARPPPLPAPSNDNRRPYHHIFCPSPSRLWNHNNQSYSDTIVRFNPKRTYFNFNTITVNHAQMRKNKANKLRNLGR